MDKKETEEEGEKRTVATTGLPTAAAPVSLDCHEAVFIPFMSGVRYLLNGRTR